MRKQLILLALLHLVVVEMKADQMPGPGYLEVFDRLNYHQRSENLYLTIFGTTTHFTPHRPYSLAQKQSFVIAKSGYVQYSMIGSTTYNDGTIVCFLGTGSVWVEAGVYQRFEVVDYGWDFKTNCHKVGLRSY